MFRNLYIEKVYFFGVTFLKCAVHYFNNDPKPPGTLCEDLGIFDIETYAAIKDSFVDTIGRVS